VLAIGWMVVSKLSFPFLGLRPGFHLRQALGEDSFQGTHLKGSAEAFESSRPEIVQAVIDCLDKRFKDVESNVLAACKLADMKTWPAALDDGTFL